jgi:hypothetical protein
MTKARPRTIPDEVWQYWPFNFITEPWVSRCTEQRGCDLFLVRRSGKQLIQPGEWLIRNLDGDPIWMDNEDFRATYELLR